MKPNVAILGTGPSAAYAYRACRLAGITPDLYGPPPGGRPHGAFYLHWLPYGAAHRIRQDALLRIIYSASGDAAGYTRKIWGREVASSFPERERSEHGYAAEPGLRALWGRPRAPLRERVEDDELPALCARYDLVVKTYPTPLPPDLRAGTRSALLLYRPLVGWKNGHNLSRHQRTAVGGPRSNGWIHYDGRPDQLWVRTANLYGELSWEFPGGVSEQDARAFVYNDPKLSTQRYVDLPPEEETQWWHALKQYQSTLSYPDNLLNVGRYATWQRKTLSHEAFQTVSERLFALSGTGSTPSTAPSQPATVLP